MIASPVATLMACNHLDRGGFRWSATSKPSERHCLYGDYAMPNDIKKTRPPSGGRPSTDVVRRSVEIHADSPLSLRVRLERLRHALSTQGGRILNVACIRGDGEISRTARVSYALPPRFSGKHTVNRVA